LLIQKQLASKNGFPPDKKICIPVFDGVSPDRLLIPQRLGCEKVLETIEVHTRQSARLVRTMV
jgi:hypothetical protein